MVDYSPALMTDMYEYTMLDAALKDGTADRKCVFEVFTRHLPEGRRYGVVAGAAVQYVAEGSCAEKAGLKVGDIITAIDDTTVSSGDALRSALRGYSAGESATLTVSRNGETLTLTVTFDRASDSTK